MLISSHNLVTFCLNLVIFFISLVTFTLISNHNLITFCLNLVTFARYGNNKLVSGMSDFFVFYPI